MAVSRGATHTPAIDTSTPLIASMSHTVDSGTTLLVVTFHCEGNNSISAVNWNTSETMTLISSVTSSAAGGDCRVYAFGLVNPTSGAHTLSWTVSGAGDNLAVVPINYLGTPTSSVADATNPIDTEDNGNNAAATVAMSGATTSGSCLLIAGTFFGADGDPGTESTAGGFSTVETGQTGTSTFSDTSYYVGDDVDGGTGGTVSPTIDWTGTASDECVGLFIEILAAAGPATAPELQVSGLVIELTYTPSGGINYDETGRQITIASTVTGADSLAAVEPLDVAIASTVGATEQLALTEDLDVAIASTVTGSEQLGLFEDLTVVVVSSITGSDRMDANDILDLVITSVVSGADAVAGIETGRQIDLTATVGATDQLALTEDLDVVIASTVTGSEQLGLFEDLTVVVVSSITGSDRMDANDILDLVITSTLTGSDSLDLFELLDLSILATITGSDELIPALAGAVESGQNSIGSDAAGESFGYEGSLGLAGTVSSGGGLAGRVEGG